MAKLERRLVAMGTFYNIEYAVDAHGLSPAARFMDELKKGLWDGDPSDPDRPSDEQIHDYERFLVLFNGVCQSGEPAHATAVNYLVDGIWEFKFNNKRVTFYDTDGHGHCDPKAKITDMRQAPEGSDLWWFPDFDRTIRLGHCFLKDGPQTNPTDIAKALQLRQEDLRHDQDT